MKTLLICLATLLANPLFAQTPARRQATAPRKTALPTRPTSPTKPANAVQAPSPAVNTQRAQPVPARQQPTQPVKPKQTSGSSAIQFGVVAGGALASLHYNGTTIVYTPDGSSYTNEPLTLSSPTRMGFHVGALVDIPLGTQFSVQPSLLYVVKGSGASTDNSDTFTDMSLSYLELPVTVFYHIPAGANSLRIGLGGYAAYGLSGSYTLAKKTTPIEFGSSEGQFSSLDYGARVAAQFQMSSGVLLGVNYSYGLGNLLANEAEKETLTNRGISFSIGYIFGGNR